MNRADSRCEAVPVCSKRPGPMIIIPAFNEENSVAAVVSSVRAILNNAEIVVIDDGSSDGTVFAASAAGAVVLKHPFNMGIGASFQTGCLFARDSKRDIIVRIDADGQHDPSYIPDLIAPIENGAADISIGSRFLGASDYKSSIPRIAGIKLISFVLSVISGQKVTDATSGFCAMNRKAFEYFAKECVEDYPEPYILLHHGDFRIVEAAVSMNKRAHGNSSIGSLSSVKYVFKVFFSLFVGMFR